MSRIDSMLIDRRYVYGNCQESDVEIELLCTLKAVFVGFVQVRTKSI